MKIRFESVLWLIAAFFLGLAFVEIGFIVCKIASNSYPFVDEFCYAASKKEGGFWRLFFDTYRYWSGRYLSNFFLLLNPLNFDSLLLFRISGFVCFGCFLLYALIPLKVLPWKNRFDYTIAWLFFVTLSLFYTHELYVAVLNFTNSISYNVSFLFFGLYYYANSARCTWSKHWTEVASYFSLIAVAGTGEQNIVLAMAYLSFNLVLKFSDKEKLRPCLDHWIFLLVTFLVVDNTSGNHLQFKERAFFSSLKSIEDWRKMLDVTIEHFRLATIALGILAMVVGGLIIGCHSRFSDSVLSLKRYALLVIFGCFSHLSLMIFLVLAQGYMLAARQFYPIFYSLSFFLFYISLRFGAAFQGNWRSKKILLPLILITIIVATYYNPLWRKNRDYYYFGIIDQYALEMDNLHQNYYSKKIDRVPIPMQHVDHTFLYPHIPLMWENAGKRYNACSARYFGMPTIEFYIPE